MKEIVYRYLSRTFNVRGNRIFYVEKRSKNQDIQLHNIITEINSIFGLSGKESKWFLRGWIKKQNKSFNFKKYWCKKDRFATWRFPLARHLATTFLCFDPAQVQPLEPLRNSVLHLNMCYRPPVVTENIVVDFTVRDSGNWESQVEETVKYYKNGVLIE